MSDGAFLSDDLYVLPLPAADPARLFGAMAGEARAFLLDGAAADPGRARFSYIGRDPFAWIEAAPGEDGFAALERALTPHRTQALPGLPPFQGGAVGFLGYEAGHRLERLPEPRARGIDLPDMAVGLYDCVAAFDRDQGRAWILSTGLPERDPARRRERAVTRARDLAGRLSRAPEPPADSGRALVAPPGWRAERTRAEHEAAVARTIGYIHAGDIYQANITQRFLARLAPGVGPLDLYRRLRPRTAAPFSAVLDLGQGRAIVSGSPERFLALEAAGAIETRPIKGTRPRGATPAEDQALAAELLASEKDRAENLMIVDLLRNDLSRVAEPGSVKVPSLCGLESYRTVHHLTSVVTARLKAGLGPVDLLRAGFPGGSITGAPKIRAMEIIHELEPARRGPYCGSVLWIGWDGAMDSSITIRTLAVAGGQVAAQAGGGIVADSDPADEYEECLVKARALLTALDPAMPWPPAASAESEAA
ncbi:MAG TPA: aminodeoxychorismate synthase component I [Azospirillaceae bacterium]|nr:aminodeoxychorismate synthase component I [Azospirillaceae bacterium]